MRKSYAILALLLCGALHGQTPVTVSATVIATNGVPYANGTVIATLVDQNGNDLSASPVIVGGQPITVPQQQGNLNSVAFFTMQLLPSGAFTAPTGTQWLFKICSQNPASYPPGTTIVPQRCFTYTTTITGPVDLSTPLHAIAPPLQVPGGGAVGPGPPPAVALFNTANSITGSAQWTSPWAVAQPCPSFRGGSYFSNYSCLNGSEVSGVDTSFEFKAPSYVNWQWLFGGRYDYIGNSIGSKSTHNELAIVTDSHTDAQDIALAEAVSKVATGEGIPLSMNCMNAVGGGSNGMEYPCEMIRLQAQQYGEGVVNVDGSGGSFNAVASSVNATTGVVQFSTPTNSPTAIGSRAFIRDLGTGSKKSFASNNYTVTTYGTFLGSTTYGVNLAVLGGTNSGLTNGSFTIYDDNISTDSPCAAASGSYGGTGAVIIGHAGAVTPGVIDSWSIASSGCYTQNSTLPTFHYGTATFTLSSSALMSAIVMFRIADTSGANFATTYGSFWTSSVNGLPAGTHMTYGNYAAGSIPMTANLFFCPAQGANSVPGGSFDGCLPIWYSDSNSSFVLALQFSGQPNDGSYPFATSATTNYTLYQGAMIGSIGGFTGTAPTITPTQFIAAAALPNYITSSSLAGPTLVDASGITQGDTVDSVLGYNVDLIGEYEQLYKPVGRAGGGDAEIIDGATATGWPYYGFGRDYLGGFNVLLDGRCSLGGTRCPKQLAYVIFDPPSGTDLIEDFQVSSATNSYLGVFNSAGTHTSLLTYNKAQSVESFNNGGETLDSKGNASVQGSFGSINGGFGPYSNQALDSLFQSGTTYWANFTLGGGGNSTRTANFGPDPFGGNTALKLVAPTLTAGQYSGIKQTTSLTMTPGNFYAVSMTLKGGSGSEKMVVTMTANSGSDPGCNAGASINLPSVFTLPAVPSAQSYTFYCTPTVSDTLAFTVATITSGATWTIAQAQACANCISTGTQVITTSATVSGNGFVNNGKPMFQTYSTSPATIPTCSSVLYGSLEFASDGVTTPTLLATYSGGGSTQAPIFCNGSAWVYY